MTDAPSIYRNALPAFLLPRLVACLVLVAATSIHASQSRPVNPDAQGLAEFTARVKAYLQLVDKADAGAPPLKDTNDPAKIVVAQEALAQRIRAARAGAKQGEIFTPEIARQFRALLRPELKGKDGAETRATIADEATAGFPLKINAKYPEEAPLSTVPPNVLLSLPTLPEEVQYPSWASTSSCVIPARTSSSTSSRTQSRSHGGTPCVCHVVFSPHASSPSWVSSWRSGPHCRPRTSRCRTRRTRCISR